MNALKPLLDILLSDLAKQSSEEQLSLLKRAFLNTTDDEFSALLKELRKDPRFLESALRISVRLGVDHDLDQISLSPSQKDNIVKH